MIVWPDCQIDKFFEQKRDEDRWFAGVAPVLPLASLAEEVRHGIRASRRRMYFYVPANDPLEIPESYVDLRHIWSVKQALLKKRVAALTADTQAAFYAQLFSFFTYQRLREPTCPKCGTEVSLFESDTAADD